MKLLENPLFAGISKQELDEMTHCFAMEQKQYREKEEIPVANRIGILLSGSVSLNRINADGTLDMLEFLTDGGIFGAFLSVVQDSGNFIIFCEKECTIIFIDAIHITKRCSRACRGSILGAVGALCIGPFLAVPRTAATTFEVGVLPLAPNFNSWIFTAIFFAVVLVLTIRPSKVVDIVGGYLTPILVIFLLIMIVVGIVNPLGPIESEPTVNAVREGTYNGYQTLDVIAAMIFIIIIANSARDKGYTDKGSLAGSLGLGIDHNPSCFIQICRLIHINMAVSYPCLNHGHGTVFHNRPRLPIYGIWF